MKLLRFATLGLCALGIAACAHAMARLAGIVPPGKLPLYPAWATAHFVSAAAFAVIAPLQLWPWLRARRPGLHRLLGRCGVGLGAVMAVSGLAMAYVSPDRPVAERIFMTSFFVVYLACLGLGLRAAIARDFASHREWMIRMTAIMLTPVTQRVVFPAFAGTLGIDGMATFWELFVSAAWLAWGLNLTVAEAWLRGGRARRPATA